MRSSSSILVAIFLFSVVLCSAFVSTTFASKALYGNVAYGNAAFIQEAQDSNQQVASDDSSSNNNSNNDDVPFDFRASAKVQDDSISNEDASTEAQLATLLALMGHLSGEKEVTAETHALFAKVLDFDGVNEDKVMHQKFTADEAALAYENPEKLAELKASWKPDDDFSAAERALGDQEHLVLRRKALDADDDDDDAAENDDSENDDDEAAAGDDDDQVDDSNDDASSEDDEAVASTASTAAQETKVAAAANVLAEDWAVGAPPSTQAFDPYADDGDKVLGFDPYGDENDGNTLEDDDGDSFLIGQEQQKVMDDDDIEAKLDELFSQL